MSELLQAADADAALELLHELGCTDGLPVVIPTADKVARLVLASGLDGDIELGDMGPANGVATVEKVACAAVMAGCLPDHMPVVVAAVRAVCQPAFDLAEMQSTTHCIAPLLIVNGPARRDCGGFASGFGLMGPGHRANAAVGRALRLAMMNIGGARPGVSDMALHGSPAKFSFCIAEDEASSPFPPLHTSFGYAPDESAVTVVGVEAPHSCFFTGDADDPASAEALLDTLAAVIANRGSNNSHLGGRGAVVVVMNPDHAEVLKRAGYDRPRVQAALAARALTPREELSRLNRKMLTGTEDLIPAVREPRNIHLLVAGGPGLYSMVMPSWCAGPHGNIAVHQAIEIAQFCELPV
ncbi:MAG: hypothetical protein K2Y51_21025 [Gammaproteobacteria bacterium]|nr:hypothetical protein [Gammaproteobacteria bacterium]